MGIVCTDIAISLDGYASGLNQSADHPFGPVVGHRLHTWMFEDAENHRAELDAITDAGAFVMGRNMFTPGRGEWDLEWKGWWGPEPPYHAPVFVLTNHAREPIAMEGGTTFNFVTDGIESALAQARDAAGDRNVAIAGGANTVNQYLAGGHLDELRLHVVPLLLGEGERLFEGTGEVTLESLGTTGNERVTHLRYRVLR